MANAIRSSGSLPITYNEVSNNGISLVPGSGPGKLKIKKANNIPDFIAGPTALNSSNVQDYNKCQEWYKKRDAYIEKAEELLLRHEKGEIGKIKYLFKYLPPAIKITNYHQKIMKFEASRELSSDEGKGITFKAEHYPPRKGYQCKLAALALLDAYFAEKYSIESIPLLAQKKPVTSLRKLAKELIGSRQGEVLQFSDLIKLAEHIGYKVTALSPRHAQELGRIIEENVEKKGLIYFYKVGHGDRQITSKDGLYAISTQETDFYMEQSEEHATVISKRFNDGKLTINHWGKKFAGIPEDLLFKSSRMLKSTRNAEYYKRTERKLLVDPKKDVTGKYKYEPYQSYIEPGLETAKKSGFFIKTIQPAPGSGFKGLMLIIEPDENHKRWQHHTANA